MLLNNQSLPKKSQIYALMIIGLKRENHFSIQGCETYEPHSLGVRVMILIHIEFLVGIEFEVMIHIVGRLHT